MLRKSLKDRLNAYLFVLPAVSLFLLMIAVPMIMGISYSFTDWTGITNKINFVLFKSKPDAICVAAGLLM